MKIEISNLKRLHSRLVGEPLEGEILKKRSLVELSGGYFSLDFPLRFASLNFERENENYSACFEIVAESEKAFKGLSRVFIGKFMRWESNDGEKFRQINVNGTGYILDKSNRAIFAISPSRHNGEDYNEHYPSREIFIGDSGAVTRVFDLNNPENFIKEINSYQHLINLYIDSLYALQAQGNRKFKYNPKNRITIYPSLFENSRNEDYW